MQEGDEQSVHSNRRTSGRPPGCDEIDYSRSPDAERPDEGEQRQHERRDGEKDYRGETGDRCPTPRRTA